MYLINTLLEELSRILPDVEWQLSPNPSLGILSTNQAFKLAKEQRKSPKDLAGELVGTYQEICDQHNLPIVISTVGPYINLTLKEDMWAKYSQNIASLDIVKDSKKIVLEYISPNVAKPLHVGHLLQANYAEAMRRILSLKYTDIITNNYWGDWGVQFGILLWAWKEIKKRNQDIENKEVVKVIINNEESDLIIDNYHNDPVDTLIKIYVWGNNQKDKVENWVELVRQEHLKIEQGDKENRDLWEMFCKDSKTNVDLILERLNIKPFDYNFGESYVEDEMSNMITIFDKINLWHKEDQGRYIDFEEFVTGWTNAPTQVTQKIKNLGRCYLIQSKNGYTTYALRDIVAKYKFARELKYDKYITFVGDEQKHHFDQIYTILGALADNEEFQMIVGSEVANRMKFENLDNIFNGIVSLNEGKMSTRKGNFITAKSILDKVENIASDILKQKNSSDQHNRSQVIALAAIKWFNLNRDIGQDSVLDIPSILKFEGNTGVYQLYTYARLNSILRKTSAENPQNQINWQLLNTDEQNILKLTYNLNYILDRICDNYKPHQLTTHLYDLATAINSWYAKYSVSDEKNLERKETLLNFCWQLKNYLKFSLDLLGIITLEEL
jgi:arginyl-tRNA synthetase